MRVVLLGATGLTGGWVLQGLLAKKEVSRVVALLRHRLPSIEDALRHHPDAAWAALLKAGYSQR